MKTQAHTPLPWKVARHGTTLANTSIEVEAENGMTVAVASYCGRAGENAYFIVKACNSHYELVAALEIAQAWLNGFRLHLRDEGQRDLDLINLTLAKAKGIDAPIGWKEIEGGKEQD